MWSLVRSKNMAHALFACMAELLFPEVLTSPRTKGA